MKNGYRKRVFTERRKKGRTLKMLVLYWIFQYILRVRMRPRADKHAEAASHMRLSSPLPSLRVPLHTALSLLPARARTHPPGTQAPSGMRSVDESMSGRVSYRVNERGND